MAMDPQTQQQLLTIGKDVIENVVVPELLTFIKAHQDANSGTLPTDAECIAALATDTAAGIAIGEAFLSAKGAL